MLLNYSLSVYMYMYLDEEKNGAYEKVPCNYGLGGGFHRMFQFLPQLTTDQSRRSRNMTEKVTLKETPTLR